MTPGMSGSSTLNEGRRLPPATTPRCRRASAVRRCAQRRPEITPGYDPGRAATRPGGRPRSTKAGDYPRLRPPRMAHPSRSVNTAQRRPEITPGYDRKRAPGTDARSQALNEGRRLPPATTPASVRVIQCDAERSTKAGDYPRLRRCFSDTSASRDQAAQRRPEITPGYDCRVPGRSGPVLPRSTKAGDYPRLRRADTGLAHLRRRRSTKAGDYPRLRPSAVALTRLTRASSAQRRPEITPGYDAPKDGPAGCRRDRSTKAGDYPRLRPVLRLRMGERQVRSTKAGDYPRLRRVSPPSASSSSSSRPLNEGRRLPPATTSAAATR